MQAGTGPPLSAVAPSLVSTHIQQATQPNMIKGSKLSILNRKSPDIRLSDFASHQLTPFKRKKWNTHN
jgi:hypothetical protein